MKRKFVLSSLEEFGLNECKHLFIAEPYVFHVLQKENKLNNFSTIEVGDYRRKLKEDLIKDSEYVDRKYEKYLPILTKRLNAIHSKDYPIRFWKKALSLGFIRYVTVFHGIYETLRRFYDPIQHDCKLLSESSFYIPKDFEDHRFCFQNSEFGAEQAFSIYMSVFHSNVRAEYVSAEFKDEIEHEGIKERQPDIPLKAKIKQHIKRSLDNFRFSRGRNDCLNDIVVGVAGSFFSQKNITRIIDQSSGKVNLIDWSIECEYSIQSQFEQREILASFEGDFDDFDKFLFASMKYCFPKSFVENFKDVIKQYEKKYIQYPKLKYLISEIWISNTYLSIFLALSSLKQIKHVTNEHNALMHPYAGSFMNHATEISDTFVTMGWYSDSFKNLIKGASLFEFALETRKDHKNKILYISGPAAIKIPHYVAHYATDEEGVQKVREFILAFFKSLPEEALKEISYRRYPVELYGIKYVSYDREYFLKDYINKFGELSNIHVPGKKEMLSAKLVIVDYISTSHLEAMHLNVPTVFFWNVESYYLKDEFKNFFDPLIEVGICQTDPVKAAKFIERIKDNPDEWWNQESTQNGKKKFFDQNFGDPQVMIDYLLSLTNDSILYKQNSNN